MWQHVVKNNDLKDLALLSLFLVSTVLKRRGPTVLLRWGPIYSIMNISVFGGVLWI